MADFGFANFGDDDDNEEEEFTFQVNGICINFRFNCSTLMFNFKFYFFIPSIHVNI